MKLNLCTLFGFQFKNKNFKKKHMIARSPGEIVTGYLKVKPLSFKSYTIKYFK